MYFCASFHIFRDINILNFDLQKVVQDHEYFFSQLQHSMVNIKIYKCPAHIFALAHTVSVSEIYFFLEFLTFKK